MFNADAVVKELCNKSDEACILLKLPRTLITKKSTFSQFNNFISALSGVFGLIKINSSIIYGDFSGKNQQNSFNQICMRS
jgi:hypothetical protein